jgi:hypothetical protein
MAAAAVVGGLLLVANVALAGKAEIEKQAKEAKLTLSLNNAAVGEALDMIAMFGGVAIKKKDSLKDAAAVTLELNEVSVLDAIEMIAKIADLTYTFVDDGIEVSKNKSKK